MSVSTVNEVRGFNRFYTRVLGLLRPQLAGSAFGLTEARVLYELAHSDQIAVSELRRVLDLDAGYLSRILSRFIADGLVDREPSTTDARRQLVRLTPRGACGLHRTRHVAGGRDRPLGGATGRGPALPTRRCDGPDPAGARRRRPAADSFSAPPSPATSDGWSSATVPATPPSTAGTSASRPSSPASSPTSASVGTAGPKPPGSPNSTANASAASSARHRKPRTPRNSVCCWSNRRRAAPVSALGWWTNVFVSRGDPVTRESCCGPTMFWLPPGGSTSGPASSSTAASRTKFGRDLVGEYWSRDL